MIDYKATYSPDDNKLRLYASQRLDAATYATVKAHGFKWAPQQGLFVAPMWTPEREDLLIDLAGDIEDEDTSLTERAEERAERFEEYKEKRTEDAERAREAVASIADNIPLGQPILVGHHSERHARKDAKRIENGMRKAVKLWETAQYWKSRAASALRHASYKERPDVRARRIRTIEAGARKIQRRKDEALACLKLWTEKPLTHEQAVMIAGQTQAGHLSMPKKDGDRPDWNMRPSAYDGLTHGHPSLYAPRSVDEVVSQAKITYPRIVAHCDRWVSHYDNRLTYERAMLDEQGGTIAEQTGPEKGGACQCWASPRGGWSYIQKVNKISVTILDNWGNGGNNFTRTIPLDKLGKILTKAQVQEIRDAEKLKEIDNGRGFYWMQSREEFDAMNPPEPEPAPMLEQKPTDFDAMKDSLNAGIQVVSVNQLFPTPKELAQRMADLADIQPGHRVLEPSAGTGMLLGALGGRMFGHNPERGEIVAVEINARLADRLQQEFPFHTTVERADFLTCNGNLGTFDRIIMNPPFSNGDDIKHIEHARTFLKPGGLLVALCANGPRQREKLKPQSTYWEDLPEGSFKEAGTNVNVALLVIE
jgi:phospholipid N-methyltransferase